MTNRFLIIEHDLSYPSMIVTDMGNASNRFDMADIHGDDFTVMYLNDDNKLYPVTLQNREKTSNQSSIVMAISEMWIEDRHTFGMKVVGHCSHTDH